VLSQGQVAVRMRWLPERLVGGGAKGGDVDHQGQEAGNCPKSKTGRLLYALIGFAVR